MKGADAGGAAPFPAKSPQKGGISVKKNNNPSVSMKATGGYQNWGYVFIAPWLVGFLLLQL